MIIDLMHNDDLGYMIEIPDVYFCMSLYGTDLSRYYQRAFIIKKIYNTYHRRSSRTPNEIRPVALTDFIRQDLLKVKVCLNTIIREHGLVITGTKGIVEFGDTDEVNKFLQRVVMEDYYFLRVYLTPQT